MDKTRLRLILKFYRNIMAPSVLAILTGIYFLYNNKHIEPAPYATPFMIKVFITLSTVAYIHILRKKEYTYYNNKGISTLSLWIYTLIPDFFIFQITMALAYIIIRSI